MIFLNRVFPAILTLFSLGFANQAPTTPQPQMRLGSTPTAISMSFAMVPNMSLAQQIGASTVAAWTKVAQCETNQQWSLNSGEHSGGLEIAQVNWVKYGGLVFSASPYLATEFQQIQIAKNIQGKYLPPDQDGCSRSGW